MNTTFLTLSAAALALTGTAAIADHHGKHNPDANGDGVVTLDEVRTQSAAMFTKMDANGDGVLNAEDRAAHRAEMFAKADTNGDGELSQAEMKAMHEARKERREERREARAERREGRMAEHFAKMDTDNSGGLSADEMRAMHEARGERGPRDRKRGMRGMRGGAGGPHGMMRMADSDGDSSVTRAEFDAGVAAHFAKADANSDGQITAEERKAAHEAMRAEWKAKRAERRGQ